MKRLRRSWVLGGSDDAQVREAGGQLRYIDGLGRCIDCAKENAA